MSDSIIPSTELASSSVRHSRNVHRTLVLLIAILLIGFGLRAYKLGARSLWWDEGASLKWASMPPGQMIEQSRSQDTNPPAYHLILHAWIGMFGNSEFAMRLLSAVAGTAAIFAIYRVGAAMFCRRAGVLAAALMAVNEMQIYYSREARSYALSTLLALITMGCAWRIVRRGVTPGRILIYVLAAALLPYVHNYGLFIIAAANVFYVVAWLLHRERVRCGVGMWVAIQIAVALLLVPYAMFIKGAVSQVGTAFWTTLPTAKDLAITFMTFSGGAVAAAIYGVLCLIAAWALLRRPAGTSTAPDAEPIHPHTEAAGEPLAPSETPHSETSPAEQDHPYNRSGSDGRMELLFLIVWLICPVLIPVIASYILMPIYTHRYAIAATPALILLAACGLEFLFRRKLIGAAATVLILSVGLYRANGVLRDPSVEPWREASRAVARAAQPHDLVLVYGHLPVFGKDLFEYYAGRADLDVHALATPYSPVSLEQVKSMAKIAQDRDRVWLIVAHEKDPSHFMKSLLESEYPHATSIDRYKRWIDITLFTKEPSIQTAPGPGAAGK
jgi:uncharacterized membrane protein